MLLQLLYRWQHQSWKLCIPPHITQHGETVEVEMVKKFVTMVHYKFSIMFLDIIHHPVFN
jgi:hypothetical protein